MSNRQKLIENVTLGSDIEWFLRNKNTHEIVSAEGIIKGTKDKPFFFDENPFFATSLDNVLAEGNIPPAKTAYAFYKSVEKLRKYIDSTIPQELETVALPSARLAEHYLKTENAQRYGCSPSINAWTREQIVPEPNGENCRAAGFHVHVGYDDPSIEKNFVLGRAIDLFLGVPSILEEPENERKSTGYGVAGNIRHTRVGMEYRSLSSFFSSSKELVQWCFRNTKAAIDFVNKGKFSMIENLGDLVQDTINNTKKEQALALIKEYNIKVCR